MKKEVSLFGPRWVFLYLLVVGIALASYSFSLPRYHDEEKKYAFERDCAEGKIAKEVYYEEVDQLITPKNRLMDSGSGLVLFSLLMLAFLFVSKIHVWSDFLKLTTKKKPFYCIASNLALLLMIPGTFWYYSYRGSRGDYPMFADSIGIPIITQTVVFLIMLIPLNLFLILALIRSQMPASLLYRRKSRRARSIVWEVVFGLCLLLNIFFLVMSIVDGDHVSVLVELFFVYVLFSLRAGKMQYLDAAESNQV